MSELYSNTIPQLSYEEGCLDLAYGFTLCWEVNISINRAVIELKYYSLSLGKWILDICHASAHINTNLETLCKSASLNVFANWDRREIIFRGKVCSASEIEKYNNVILSNW